MRSVLGKKNPLNPAMLARACRVLLPRAAALRPPPAARSYHEVLYARTVRCDRGARRVPRQTARARAVAAL